MNNWYVITGGPSSGKTTLLAALAAKGHKTVEEAARTVIDTELARGKTIADIRGDEEKFQHNVLDYKIELEKQLSPMLTFFDRGMHDSLAYLRHYGWQPPKRGLEAFENASYKRVFLLEPLPTYTKDYARTEDASFVEAIHSFLAEAYRKYGMEPVSVPVMSVPKRVQFILNNL